MAESSEDVLQSVYKVDNNPSHNSQTELQSVSSSTTEFEKRRSTNVRPNTPEPIQTEEDNLLQAACTILYTVPRAIEHYIDREYNGGFLQAIRDYKDQLKVKLRSEEWDLLSQLIVHHRLYHFYDQIIQDTILDNEVLDLLISRCILRKEDRAEIEHHPRQSDRNKCILDFLIIRPEDSYSVLLEVLKESLTCSKDLIECMEGQLYSHRKVVSKSKVRSSKALLPSLTNSPGFQTMVTLVAMVKAVQISKSEPKSHDTSLSADLYRLQCWYKKMLKMTVLDLHQYQQFVQTVKEILVRLGEDDDPVDITWNVGMQKQVRKVLCGFKEKEELSDIKEKIVKMENEQNKVIPKNIRDQIENEVKEWREKDKMFVTTRASEYVLECLQDNSCLTLTAPSGVGKSFIARHTALVLQKEGYRIIPVRKPDDIRDYYKPGKQTVFIIDDICGNFTANQQQIENWQQMLPVINTIIEDKCCKIIVSCRLQVYRDDKFNVLEPFKSCECNLISDKLCLTAEEKGIMASIYIDSNLNNIDKSSQNSEFFPLLCSLYNWKKHGDVKEFFKNPFFVYQNELDSLSRYGDEGNYKICSLALLVLFNNQLTDKWIQGTVTREQRHLIKGTCDACGLNRGTSKAKLKEALLTLEGTFVHKQNGIYRAVHDKLFDFLAHYFGKKMIECLLDHGDSDLVHGRFIWRQSQDENNSNIDFIIEIPDEYFEVYLERFIKDWLAGKVRVIFENKNMEIPLFRQQLLPVRGIT